MLKFFIWSVFISVAPFCFSQKPPINESVFGKWQAYGPSTPSLSNDGTLLYYFDSRPGGKPSITFKKTFSQWELKIANVAYGKATITSDNQFAIFIKGKDSLGVYQFSDSSFIYFSNVISYRSLGVKIPFIIYKLKGSKKETVVYDLKHNERSSFFGIEDYWTVGDNCLLTLGQDSAKKAFSLSWSVIDSSANRIIWEGSKPDNLIIDESNRQVAFIVGNDRDASKSKEIWYYNQVLKNAKLLADSLEIKIDSNLELGELFQFSSNGKFLFVNLKEKSVRSNSVGVNVWSYHDAKLQSIQLNELSTKKTFRAVINIASKKITQINYENEKMLTAVSPNEFVLIENRSGDQYEWNWNQKSRSSIYLVSLRDGSRKLIGKNVPEDVRMSYTFSNTGQFVVYYDAEQKGYFSYEISTARSKNITAGISAKWTKYDLGDIPASDYFPIGIAGFTENDSSVLLYDQNDIYKVSLKGARYISNLTRGYGSKNNISFRLALDHSREPFIKREQLILKAFDRNNKNDGFFRIKLEEPYDPILLTMKACIFSGTIESSEFYPFPPKKAKNANIYIVRRMTASEYPSFFYTNDFISFTPATSMPYHPQKQYNWLTTKLITWKTLNGKVSQGILYKPEDFDSNKKYPIIFYYYEKLTEGLNGFLYPNASDGTLNIPYYVSNGYIVFVADIHYNIGKPGRSAFNSIVSAANYFAKKRWIDSKKMAIQGHSFGGFETNYIVTKTDIFACAMSSSGMSNFVSAYGSIVGDGSSRQRQYELYRDRIGSTLWDSLHLYLENSPVLQANKIKSPMLLMANKKDYDVPYNQGIELFTALRRLEKNVWMLEYDNGEHMVGGEDSRDLTIRMRQFFDHYLKHAPAPIWMTQGIPARLKGVITGYDLDPSNSCGKDCKVCKMWNEKMKKDSARTMKEIQEKAKSEHWMEVKG
jgi:dienelactone hydrolase